MIANCPSCGTHYKHQTPVIPIRARCGRCDTMLDLTRFRPYRIVPEAAPTRRDATSAANYLPIGLDHPSLATTIAHNLAYPVAPLPLVEVPDVWDYDDPLPLIPEVELKGAFGESAPAETLCETFMDEPGIEDTPQDVVTRSEDGSTAFALWIATAAIVGTGASWTMGGTTLDGMAAGAFLGAVGWWGWRRWVSPR